MAFVEINPKYHDLLRRHGLVSADDFLRLPAVVIGGHPDRHVAQVSLGQGPDAITAFLKREHRVCWKDRLANAWSGFGFASKALREALLLQRVRQAGINAPEWIAVGEDDAGRAFLLLRELAGWLDLRVFLRQRPLATPRERYRFARKLGEALARVHAAGFDHPDLYAKHVLVDPDTEDVSLLDWQRSRSWVSVGWRRRCRDLAALQATVADNLARPRERLACLRAYLRTSGATCASPDLHRVARSIRRLAEGLLRRRHVREQQQPPLRAGTQNLIWLDGEALCVTREFWSTCRADPFAACGLAYECQPGRDQLTSCEVHLPGGGHGVLLRRRVFRPFAWLWEQFRRRRPLSPELRQAGILFRLQRYGVPTPRLLAVGQRERGPGGLESFLLLEPLPDTVSLLDWLSEHGDRQRLFREALALLRRLHEAGCHLAADEGDCPFLVQDRPGNSPALVLGSVAGVGTRRRLGQRHVRRDLAMLERLFALAEGPDTPAELVAGGRLAGQEP